jgi:acyl-CoA synthetase (AMP-forming)/AMP-acid ligase II
LQHVLMQMDASEAQYMDQTSPLYRSRTIELLDVSAALRDVEALEETMLEILVQELSTPQSLLELFCRIDRLFDATAVSKCSDSDSNVVSHICFTSGTTGGAPKGCISSRTGLGNYLASKNRHHGIDRTSRVLLASSISFDPCLSDILATFTARATLIVTRREMLLQNLLGVLHSMRVTHCLCTPTLWSTTLVEHTGDQSSMIYSGVPLLECVALGGERIPARLRRAWTRPSTDTSSSFRLCATYGVTEACVYQTMGLVERNSDHHGVGVPFDGMSVLICVESEQERLVELPANSQGEVILCGNQLDDISSYLIRPELTSRKFVKWKDQYFYRTGDRGFIDVKTNNLHIVGRIEGEEGMLKVNGVRIELSEIEAAVVDDRDDICVVVDCMAVAQRSKEETTGADGVICYVVLSSTCLKELEILNTPPTCGAICASGPLLKLLSQRCSFAKTTPSAFVVVPRVPLSPTGKRDRRGTPRLCDWVSLESLSPQVGVNSVLLEEYSRLGKMVADVVSNCLNLQPVQKAMLTTQTSFGMAGGDSLAATRIVRALYASHNNIPDSRLIGGEYGILDGPFAPKYLINATSLKAYVDWLEEHGVCGGDRKTAVEQKVSPLSDDPPRLDSDRHDDELYDALFEAAARGYTNIGLALLDIGADPTRGSHGGRIGKISSRLERKRVFRSSPLHLACIRGDSAFVRGLIKKGAAMNSPDASGLFPLHLVAAGEPGSACTEEDDLRRIDCVKALLESGAPLSMKDGQKQTVIHVAARAGRQEFLRYIMKQREDVCIKVDHRKAGSLDWRDSFNRTPVHWAVLNGHVESLRILLQMGCCADPIKLKHAKTSSLTQETPMEMCNRLYDVSNQKGEQIRAILSEHR